MTINIQHHPREDLLIAYAAGKCSPDVNLIISTHLHYCPCCADFVASAEAIGGDVLKSETDKDFISASDKEFDDFWNNIIEKDNITPEVPVIPLDRISPLEHYMRRSSHYVKRKKFFTFTEDILPSLADGSRVSVMNLSAGTMMPAHTHDDGLEMTLVLEGGYSDEFGTYNKGDFVIANSAVTHTPRVFDDEDCKCLIVNTARIRLTGRIGSLFDPIFRLIY